MPDTVARVAVDVIGGDHAPGVILEGVARALAGDPALEVLLVGPADVVGPVAGPRRTPVTATEFISMDEHPAAAVRAKKDSSIVVGCRLVRERSADAFFSAGSTGACVAAATLGMGRVRDVSRPAIAAVIPGVAGPTVLLDVGANADVKPDMLVQFAHMGRAYARTVLGVVDPSVALLNIGEEETKGSAIALEAHALMKAAVPGFMGNAEGRDVSSGRFDVIVTDGFTGNVTLKALEGLASSLMGQFKAALTERTMNKLAAMVVAPSLARMKRRLDPEVYGGAPLLGVDGVCVIGHGSSGPTGVANGIGAAARAARGCLTEAIAEGISGTGS